MILICICKILNLNLIRIKKNVELVEQVSHHVPEVMNVREKEIPNMNFMILFIVYFVL